MKISNDMRKKLIEEARLVRKWSYAPYSHYAVGAALLAESGKIYSGVNVENAAYPNGICAERTALFRAVTEGERNFEAIAVVSEMAALPVAPADRRFPSLGWRCGSSWRMLMARSCWRPRSGTCCRGHFARPT